ncbi:MAG: sulfite exporter TauE/SafE family protein [Planctomycetota bacterium]|nr:sulfite exporter TauE/SafE family protein [Planctomycetota bacterium]MDA0933049.1 sulfite exporter TauE/SafE family protein [Planctomycetota bacterium]
MIAVLFVALGLFAAAFAAVWLGAIRSARRSGAVAPGLGQLTLGFVTNFFDSLGVGNFAPTAAVFRMTRMVPDAQIPGTMNVGHTLPVVLMAFLFISSVDVEPWTLGSMIGAAVVGAWVGAGVVARLPRRAVQIGMGGALLTAAVLMTSGMLRGSPVGGTALGLSPVGLAIAVPTSVLLGALNTLGVGLYAPCMILVALLGMDPKAAFPIMMGSCAFLMPVGSVRFVRENAYSLRPALGLTLGGLPAVLIAVYLVRELSLDLLRWLVVGVATYAAVLMLAGARRAGQPASD